jgi:hypothetical protein
LINIDNNFELQLHLSQKCVPFIGTTAINKVSS